MKIQKNENIISENNGFVLLHSCSDEMELNIVAGLLESNGIEVKVKKVDSSIFPGFTFSIFSGKSNEFEIYVRKEDFEEAKNLIDAVQKESAEEVEKDSYEKIEEDQFRQQIMQTEKRQNPIKRLSLLIFTVIFSYLAIHNNRFREIPLEIVIGIIFLLIVIVYLKGRRDQAETSNKDEKFNSF